MMFRTALVTLLLSVVAQAKTPDNVSSRLMIHVSSTVVVAVAIVDESDLVH